MSIVIFFFAILLKLHKTIPVVVNPIPDQNLKYGDALNFIIPKNTFYSSDTIQNIDVSSLLPNFIQKQRNFNFWLDGTLDTYYSFGVFVEGKYAFISDGPTGLKIVDVSDKTNPILEGSLDTHDAYGLYVLGDFVFIADGMAGLKIVDVRNKTNPILEGSLDTTGYANGVYVSGNYAFIADSSAGLKIVDVTDKSNPILEGSLDSNSAQRVYVSGNNAFIADGTAGLKIVDVTDKSNPILEGSINSNEAFGVYVSGNYAFIADGTAGLKIIDVTDKSNPILEGSINSNEAFGVYVSGDLAFLADGMAGLKILDVSDKKNPILEGNINTTGNSFGVYVSGTGNYAYTSDYGAGLKVIGFGGDELRLIGANLPGDIEVSIEILASDVFGSVSDVFKLIVECNYGWMGSNCSFPICFNVSNQNEVCSGHGKCFAPDSCNCSLGYFNENCDERDVDEDSPVTEIVFAIMIPVCVVTLIIIIIIIVVVLLLVYLYRKKMIEKKEKTPTDECLEENI